MNQNDNDKNTSTSRRGFIKSTAAAAVGASLVTNAQVAGAVDSSNSETIKVGLVGCGGRGRGSAVQALKADPNTRLVALADVFPDQIYRAVELFKRVDDVADRVEVPRDRFFSGFDAYQKMIDSDVDVDVVLLATPPHFRPYQLEACIKAGKHVFAEKPVAVDAAGIQKVIAACDEAKKKDLAVVSGLCWRYHSFARAAIEKVHDGAIGRIVSTQSVYNASRPGKEWPMKREDSWGDMEWQLRNWYWFTWLSGDHIVEQAIHSMDKIAWAMHDEPPVSAVSLGGLQARHDTPLGTIFDHHAVVYEHANGVKHFHSCRQQPGCKNDVSTHIIGTDGVCEVEKAIIRDHDGETVWRYRGEKGRPMHQVEQDELFASIRAGKPINNGDYMSKSTMLAILGRMASYTGQKVTWEQAMNSKEDFTPASYAWDVKLEVPPIAVPGVTPFV
ncbi:MAG TPA: Gfo/Idh/MocA family oxidoreductase [Pirellulaceae bacterium]|nr:Gfo/Idh/MocA family oxidoreductase [Pirellulaceae bacterium]